MSDLELDSTMGGVGTQPMLSEWMSRAELAAELARLIHRVGSFSVDSIPVSMRARFAIG